MANEQTSVTRVADCGELPLLLDKSSRHDRRYRSEPRALQPYITFDGHRPRYESEFFTASLRPDRQQRLLLWAAIRDSRIGTFANKFGPDWH